VEVYTIGFTKRSAREFFATLKEAGIEQLVDVRIHNSSQLAGFTKAKDLEYFLEALCGATYRHEPLLAPTPELLSAYRKKQADWAEYERRFLALMAERRIQHHLEPDYFAPRSVLLCSEPTPSRCHRRLVLEYLTEHWPDLEIKHL